MTARVVILLGLVSLVGYGLCSCTKVNPDVVVIAESSLSASDALSFIARSKGYWKEEGLDVRVLSFTAGKQALDALLSGQATFAFAGETSLAVAAFRNQSYGVLAEVASSARELALIGRRDRGISTVADLPGKKVAITQGTQSDYFLYRSLRAAGIRLDSVATIALQPPEMPRAVVQGDVDAVSVWQPHSSRAATQLGDNGMTLPTDGTYFGIVSLVSSRAFVFGHPDTVKKLLQGLLKAEAFLQGHPAEAQRIISDQIKLDPAVLALFYADYDFRVQLTAHLLHELTEEGQWAQAVGIAPPTSALPDYGRFVLSEPLNAVGAGRVNSSPR